MLGRVRRGSREESAGDRSSSRGAAARSSATTDARSSGSTGNSSSSTSGVESVTTQSGTQAFRIQVPQGAKPGDTIRFRAPDGRLVEIDLPPGCTPGQKVTIEIDPEEDWRRTLKEFSASVKTSFEATTASCNSLRASLKEELELQRGLWASASATPQSQFFNQQQGRRPQDLSVVASGAEELSQTQALVFACAEAGDGKQLLAALAEARPFSAVSRSLEECVESLNAAEEAMITWRCLLDSLQAENRHEIEVWVEEARSLGLQAPSGLPGLLNELRRREEASLKQYAKVKEVEDKVKFALETGDPELLADVVAEAESMGAKGPIMQQASARVRDQQRQRLQAADAEAAAGLGPRLSQKSGQAAAAARPQQSPVGGQWLPKPKPSGGSSASTEQPHNSGGGGATSSSSPYAAYNGGGAEAGAGPSPESRQAPSTPYGQPSKAPDDGKGVKELLEECRRLGIDTTGCVDANDLRRLLVNGNKSKELPRTAQAPQGFVKQVPASQANQAGGNTVWSRQFAPPQHVSKRSKCLYLLGLDPYRAPPAAEMRSAYRRAAMECHPDRAQNHARQEQAKELFQKVKEAFDFLSSS